MASGAVAAAVAWVVGYPADVLKTRIQGSPQSMSLTQASRDLLSREPPGVVSSVRALYRGLGLKLLRAVPSSAVPLRLGRVDEAAAGGAVWFLHIVVLFMSSWFSILVLYPRSLSYFGRRGRRARSEVGSWSSDRAALLSVLGRLRRFYRRFGVHYRAGLSCG